MIDRKRHFHWTWFWSCLMTQCNRIPNLSNDHIECPCFVFHSKQYTSCMRPAIRLLMELFVPIRNGYRFGLHFNCKRMLMLILAQLNVKKTNIIRETVLRWYWRKKCIIEAIAFIFIPFMYTIYWLVAIYICTNRFANANEFSVFDDEVFGLVTTNQITWLTKELQKRIKWKQIRTTASANRWQNVRER